MRYVPTQGTPLPFGFIDTLYYRTSPQAVSLRYTVELRRQVDGGPLVGIAIRDLQEGSETVLPVESLETHTLGHGLVAIENLLDRHSSFNLLEDLFITRDLDAVVEDGGRYFRLRKLMNERTPLPPTLAIPEDFDRFAEFADQEPDGTGRASFQYLLDRLGLGIEVVSSRHTRSGFAGTEVYDLVLELAGRRERTTGGLTGHYSTNGFSLPALDFDELGRASFAPLEQTAAAPVMRALLDLGTRVLDRHNLTSTATEEELRRFAAAVLTLWNSTARPALNEALGRPRDCNEPFPNF